MGVAMIHSSVSAHCSVLNANRKLRNSALLIRNDITGGDWSVAVLYFEKMIPKCRQLGLGLFLPAKETATVERPPENDVASTKVYRDSNVCPGTSPWSDGKRSCKPVSGTLTRRSYGLELFEAECSKERQRKEKERDKGPCRDLKNGPVLEISSAEDSEELRIQDGELVYKGEDSIKLVKKRKIFGGVSQNVRVQCYLIIIPKQIMKAMPKPPDSYVTPSSVPDFYLRVLMVQMNDTRSVDAAVNWLLSDGEEVTGCTIGLDCEYGTENVLNLIQLSLHQRCVLIRVPATDNAPQSPSNSIRNPDRLAYLLATPIIVKTGHETQNHAFAIYWATGMIVNGFKNVSEVYIFRQRPLEMMAIFRKLYNWEWSRQREITRSDWGRQELSAKQIKYGIMDAWSSRMVALEGLAAVDGAVTLMSLDSIPSEVLDLFGRCLVDVSRYEQSSSFETSGTIIKTSDPGTLQLMQHSFRSRVKGKCVVEMNFKEEGSAQFKVKSRKGKSVLLTPLQNKVKSMKNMASVAAPETSNENAPSNEFLIESVASLTVLEAAKTQVNWQRKRLWEGLTNILCNPAACPRHLLIAFGYDVTSFEKRLVVVPDLSSEPFKTISNHLNDSQKEAWQAILTSPLSATIGPPGTGKTSLISAVARSWIAAREGETSNEVLVCTAYQNVAVRHLAETLVEAEVLGVLLLISEDYYLGWHEGFYTEIADSVVVSTADQCEFSMNLTSWRAKNGGRVYPNVVVCTVDLVGGPSFARSLSSGKVTALIIDESSQASDMSFLRPLVSLPDLAIVSVLGDPNQLPPYSARSVDQNVPSVFDMVSKGCRVNFLREQYRMPPSICDFLSSEIYDSVLTTAPCRVKERDSRPLLWSHVRGVAVTEVGKTSMYNTAETKAILRFCQMLVGNMQVACEKVVVLTLYEEQTRRISEMLASNNLEIPVHNVDSFQGQQCDIVLISLVVGRSFSPFAADERRACVMLSRVRRLLCVFGDFDEVKRNQQAGLWMKLATHCKKRNLVVDEDKVDCFLGPSFEDAGETGTVQIAKKEVAKKEVKCDTAAVGFPVQVMFKAR